MHGAAAQEKWVIRAVRWSGDAHRLELIAHVLLEEPAQRFGVTEADPKLAGYVGVPIHVAITEFDLEDQSGGVVTNGTQARGVDDHAEHADILAGRAAGGQALPSCRLGHVAAGRVFGD
jgi:hypothetical protein